MKNLLSMFLVFCMIFNMAVFAIPVLDGAESAVLAEEEASEKIMPGVNVFTGDTNAITFDTEADLEYVTVGPRWMANAVVDYEINSVSGRGNMLRFKNTNAVTDASEHFVVKLAFKADSVVDRPAYFIARVYDACTYWSGLGGGWMRQNASGNWSGGTISKILGEDNIPNSDTFQVEPWAIYSNDYWMCIDNVAVIPYYQITYKNILPDGTTGEDIVKYELDTTNISVTTNDGIIAGLPTSFKPNEELAYDGYTFLGWSTEENASVAMANVSLSNEDITLYPVWVEGGEAEGGDTEISLKPGVNVFTGTKNAITFNTEADLKYVKLEPRWDKNAIVDYQIGERTAYRGIGKSIMFKNTNGKTDASGHFVTRVTATMPITVDRPAFMIARVCDAYTQWRNDCILRSNTAGDWMNGEIKKLFDGDAVLNLDSFFVDVWSLDGNSYWMYLDNIAVIPYYKVTYKNVLPDGTTGEDVVKYELDTSAISVSSNDGVIAGLPEVLQPSETLEYEGYTLLGWSLTEGATEVSEITLANEDIVLYPVWKSGQTEPEPEPEVPSELILEDVHITEDGESITITPVLVMESGNTLSDFTGMKVLYDIDNINVSPVINANGSLTITGKMNGETKVGVSLTYEDATFTATAVVTVSGQIAKSPANNIKLITYGNSIMDHGPSDELSWTGNWGMAASSKENDYVHQLISLIEGKYGKGSVTHVFGQKNNGFEGETNSATLDTDWETKLDGLSEWIASQNPDVITVQYGENSQQPDEAIYEKALTAFVNELKKGAPDAVILVTTPYWSNTGMGTNIGSRATAEKLGIPLADVASLTHIPGSMATGLFEHPGVAAHPSDYGMKLIAEEMFKKLNPYFTGTIEQNYTDIPDSIEITSSHNTITDELGTLKLTVKVNPETAAQDVIFSSSDEDIATVDENGVVTARNNGTVTITATSKYSEDVLGTIEITVSEQTEPFTVTYDKNTDDEVNGMPENNTKAKYETALSTVFPERKYYKFKGWSTSKEGNTIDSLNVTEDVTVYAIWEEAYRWTFDRDGYSEGIVIENGFNQKIENGRFTAMATYTDESTGNVLTIKSPELYLDSSEFASFTLSIQNTIINSDTAIKLSIFTDGETFEYSKDVTSSNPAMYRFDLSDVNGIITGFEIVPTNIDATIHVEELFFNKKSVPGLNVFNGTNKGITFETDADLSYVSIAPAWDKNAVIDYGIGERTSYRGIGKSLMFKNTNGKTDASGHFVTRITASMPASVDRPAFLIARVCDAYTQWRSNGALRTNTASDWMNGQISKVFDEENILNSDKISIDALSLDGNSYLMYLDNLAVIPYYKVTYKNVLPDGSDNGETVKYWLNTEELSVLTDDGIIAGLPQSYIPDEVIYSDSFRLSGWTTDENSSESMNEIPLRNKDIVLYPIWEEYIDFTMALSGEENIYIDGNTSVYKPVFSADIPEKKVLWSVDNTDIAEIDENGVLTPYSEGTVTVKCTSVYNPEITAEMTVNVSYIEFEAEIIGADSIRKEYRSEKYRCEIVSGDIPVKAFTWSVDNKSLASINRESGVLTPYDNGVVTVTATSVYNPNYSVSIEVALTEQLGAHTVTYMPGTDDDSVTGLPEAEMAAGTYELSKSVPQRDGYVFIGWSKEEGKIDTVDSISVRADTTVYAVWAKGFGMEFNGDRGLITSVASGKITESEDKLIVTTGASGDIRFSFKDLNIDPDEYKMVEIRMAVEKKNAMQLFYKGEITENGEKVLYGYNENGYRDAETYSVVTGHLDEGLDNWFVINLNMYNVAPSGKASWNNGTAELIKNIWLDITDEPNSVVYIDYIRFISEMPENTVEKPSNGNGSGNAGPKVYPTEVETLTKPGTIGGNGEESELNAVPLNFKGVTDEITVNFADRTDSGLFSGMRNAELISVENSEITIGTLGTDGSPSAFETYNLDLDADTHRYIVIKSKSLSLTSNKVRLYFAGSENNIYRGENSAVFSIGGDYSMTVIDMSKFSKWKGSISRLLFSFMGKVEGSFKIDWIMFTDSVPEHMDDVAGVSEKFPTANRNAMTFTDVAESDWFYSDVTRAYRLGFVNGITEKAYSPYGSVTVAEAITVAVRMNRIYNGEEVLAVTDASVWYMPYVEDAISRGIIKKTQFESYDKPATRKEVAQIISKALPASWYNAINVFEEIPDLEKSDKAFGAVIRLYEAGVVIGSDDKFSFLPDSNITRAELAAILGRCAIPDSRKRVVTDAERELLKKVFYAENLIGVVSLESCTAYGFKLDKNLAWAKSTVNDPIVYIRNLTGDIDGEIYRTIRIGMKWDTEKVKDPVGAGCQIFFTTPEGSWSDSRRLVPKWDGKIDENGVGEFVFELSSNSQTDGMITNMRFDPFDVADAEFAIEYIIIE